MEIVNLSKIPNVDLVTELSRRLSALSNGQAEAMRSEQDLSGSAEAEPFPVGGTPHRTQLIRQLFLNRRGLPFEALRFLVHTRAPQTMSAIVKHMLSIGYRNKRSYYDVLNSLVDAGVAKKAMQRGIETWEATSAGSLFVDQD